MIVRLFRIGSVLLLILVFSSLRAQTAVEIDLQEQAAYLIQDGRVVLATPIASGRYGHLTPTGSFKIIEKERNHYSSMYGKIATATYIVTVTMAMLFNYLGYHSPLVDLCIYGSLAITLVSGFHYIWHASRLLSQPA